jgi:DNA-directed RNA polymerase specialized sigma24 family protein
MSTKSTRNLGDIVDEQIHEDPRRVEFAKDTARTSLESLARDMAKLPERERAAILYALYLQLSVIGVAFSAKVMQLARTHAAA